MKFESELLKGVAPVVALEILSRGRMYGYELSEEIEKRSGNIPSINLSKSLGQNFFGFHLTTHSMRYIICKE